MIFVASLLSTCLIFYYWFHAVSLAVLPPCMGPNWEKVWWSRWSELSINFWRNQVNFKIIQCTDPWSGMSFRESHNRFDLPKKGGNNVLHLRSCLHILVLNEISFLRFFWCFFRGLHWEDFSSLTRKVLFNIQPLTILELVEASMKHWELFRYKSTIVFRLLPVHISASYDLLIIALGVEKQALQYVQENPDEVCPAGWKPGEKSMKPDPKGSKEYFASI